MASRHSLASMTESPSTVIAGHHVVLRPWVNDDIEALIAIYNDPVAARYVDVPQPYDAAQARAFVIHTTTARRTGAGFHYAVTLRESDAVVGSAYLHDVDPVAGTTEVSYLIHPDHRGRGLASDALEALASAALEAGFSQVLAQIGTSNHASEFVARRSGFRPLGIIDGENYWHRTTAEEPE